MKIIEPSVEIIDDIDGEKILKKLETCGRTCYQSEPKEDSADKFIRNIIKRGHESVLEHIAVTARFICSRACSHQLVRHRLASFSQESMRFCNYSKDKFGDEITVIKPRCFKDIDTNNICYIPFEEKFNNKLICWLNSVEAAEHWYLSLITEGAKSEDARGVLPQDTKTTVVMTANLREWRHVFNMRCDSHAQEEIRELCTNLLCQLHDKIPVVFDDLYDKFVGKISLSERSKMDIIGNIHDNPELIK